MTENGHAAPSGVDRVTQRGFAIAHVSTVHARNDTRIALKELRTLAAAELGAVCLCVQDGRGNDVAEQQLFILDMGPRPSNRCKRFVSGAYRVWRSVTRVRPRIVHFHDPELIVVCVLLKLLGFRVIYDVHENLPLQILYKDWIPRFLRAPMASCATVLERLGAARFDGVVAATPSISSRFPSSKTTVVQNFPRPEELWCVDGGAIRDREPLAAYVGGITEIRGAREMIEALARVPSKYRLKLCMAGAFSTEELRHELMRSAGWSKVEEQGWIARDAVARLMSRARMGLLVFHPVPNHLESQPNKLFEYMSAGLPVIASDFPLWRDIAGSCGIFVDPLDPQAIADAIVWLLDHPDESERLGRKGRNLVETKYNWAREGEKLVRFYRELMR